jgi:hypothetical protein
MNNRTTEVTATATVLSTTRGQGALVVDAVIGYATSATPLTVNVTDGTDAILCSIPLNYQGGA